MAQIMVGVRQLKEQLSSYLRQLKAGHTVVITERGKPIARMLPVVNASVESRMSDLAASGIAAWSGRKLRTPAAPVRARGKRSVAALLVEDRE